MTFDSFMLRMRACMMHSAAAFDDEAFELLKAYARCTPQQWETESGRFHAKAKAHRAAMIAAGLAAERGQKSVDADLMRDATVKADGIVIKPVWRDASRQGESKP